MAHLTLLINGAFNINSMCGEHFQMRPKTVTPLSVSSSTGTLLFSSLFPYHNSHPLHSLHLSNGFKSWIRCNSLHRSLQRSVHRFPFFLSSTLNSCFPSEALPTTVTQIFGGLSSSLNSQTRVALTFGRILGILFYFS